MRWFCSHGAGNCFYKFGCIRKQDGKKDDWFRVQCLENCDRGVKHARKERRTQRFLKRRRDRYRILRRTQLTVPTKASESSPGDSRRVRSMLWTAAARISPFTSIDATTISNPEVSPGCGAFCRSCVKKLHRKEANSSYHRQREKQMLDSFLLTFIFIDTKARHALDDVRVSLLKGCQQTM